MLHDSADHSSSQAPRYEPPRISEIGSLQEHTLVINKTGPSSDMFSNLVPIVGSINPVH